MTWTIEVSSAAKKDVTLLFEHLVDSYLSFGDGKSSAVGHASKRVDEILTTMERIATAPYRGQAQEEMLPGLQHLTLNRAIYWYQVEVEHQKIRILAIFYGGQDHIRRMLLRLIDEEE